MKFLGQSGVERVAEQFARAGAFAAPAENTRRAIKLKRIRVLVLRRCQQRKYFARYRGQSSQVHLIMTKNRQKRFSRTRAQKIKINLRNQIREHIAFAFPAENMALQLSEARVSNAQAPKLAGRMEQVEMHERRRRLDCARHAETRFEQWPVE